MDKKREKNSTEDQELSELEQALLIDEHALNEMIVQHPDLSYRVGKKLAMLISQRDAAEQNHKEVMADVDTEIRAEAADAKDRVTADEVKALVLNDPRVKDAQRTAHQLRHAVGVWSALQEAYKARSYALNNLSTLYVHNYTSTNIGSGRSMLDRTSEEAKAEIKVARRR
ncbi:MAG: hypothetical protein MN733_43410 [Nitrososphaera sp.]|nr:hypothetical protein [Nitrososphaera sp.]